MSLQVLAIAVIPAVLVVLVAAVTHSRALTLLTALLAAAFAIFYGRSGYTVLDLLVLAAGCWVAWLGLSRLDLSRQSTPQAGASAGSAPRRQGRSLLGRLFIGSLWALLGAAAVWSVILALR